MKTEKLISFEELSELPKEGRYEIVEGRLLEMSPAGGRHAYAVARLTHMLYSLLKDRGYVFSGELGLLIKREPLTLRASDIAFYSKERLREVPSGFLHEPPDLVVEVVSEPVGVEYLEEKLRDYMSFGVGRMLFIDLNKELILLIDEERRIGVYSFEEEVEMWKGVKVKMKEVLA
jgi:Uma2 family endonuclease